MEINADVLLEILGRCTAKLVIKFRAVSKFVRDSTYDPLLPLLQSRATKFDSGVIIQGYENSLSFLPLDRSCGVPYGSIDYLREAGTVLCSTNGLLLYKTKSDSEERFTLFLYNPAKKTMYPVPNPPEIDVRKEARMGIAISVGESATDAADYRIIYLSPSKTWLENYLYLTLYNGREKKWSDMRKFYSGVRNIDLEHPVVTNKGTMYLVSECFPYIAEGSKYYRPYIIEVEIDSNEETLGNIIPVPGDALVGCEHEIGIAAWGKDSICVIRCEAKAMFTVWAMTDIHTRSWTRVYDVPVPWPLGSDFQQLMPSFTLMNKNMMVYTVDDMMYAYKLEDGEVKEIGRHSQGGRPSLRSYANTLRPCGRVEWELIDLSHLLGN